MKLIDIDFTDSCFDENFCFEFENNVYEDLRDSFLEEENIKFRVVLSDDDYDYVEDTDLIKKLEAARS
jgi:hypothetical protein